MTYINRAYESICEYYGEGIAKRSKLPLINHINEGLNILDYIHSGRDVKEAWCLHPLLQNNVPIELWYSPEIRDGAISLAVKYSYYANSFLCTPENDSLTIDDLRVKFKNIPYDVSMLLYADKLQNLKDFLIFHMDSHARSKELYDYFQLWLSFLREELDWLEHEKLYLDFVDLQTVNRL